ncbi:hypothetical protein AK812_SmicGene8190 [Symbiodinium microadriaticum]|uniref:Uncharacterized protein n=1 Tax=Symbiodinium microadriaticum TaxID=2951 RepID=A0A1Q9ELJ9_SYMMI|nr:hypothetical protein AK812_SmicGene8190 [Symbiodinium microadriaticum]
MGLQRTVEVACYALNISCRQALHKGVEPSPKGVALVEPLFGWICIPCPLITTCDINVTSLSTLTHWEPYVQKAAWNNNAVLKRACGGNAMGDQSCNSCPAVAGVRRADDGPSLQLNRGSAQSSGLAMGALCSRGVFVNALPGDLGPRRPFEL